MTKVVYKVLNTARLPLKVSRGSEAERMKMARKMSDKLAEKITSDSVTFEQLTDYVNEILKPYKIVFEICENTDNRYKGSSGLKLNINEELLNVEAEGYSISLTNKNGLTDKNTAIHEFGHMFDKIYNPKLVRFTSLKLFFEQDLYDKINGLKDLFKQKWLFNLKGIFKSNIKQGFTEIPDEFAIDALQDLRAHFKTEIRQYDYDLKRAVKNKNVISIAEEVIVRNMLKYKTKLRFANKLLKERLKIARDNIANSSQKK